MVAPVCQARNQAAKDRPRFEHSSISFLRALPLPTTLHKFQLITLSSRNSTDSGIRKPICLVNGTRGVSKSFDPHSDHYRECIFDVSGTSRLYSSKRDAQRGSRAA